MRGFFTRPRISHAGQVLAALSVGFCAAPGCATRNEPEAGRPEVAEATGRSLAPVVDVDRARGVIRETLETQPQRQNPADLNQAEFENWQQQYQRRLEAERSGVAQDSANLDGALGDIARYTDQLHRLAKTYPKTDKALAFRQVAIESPLWTPLLSWSRMLATANGSSMEGMSPKQARELLEEANQLRESAPISPAVFQFDNLRPYIHSIASRIDLFDKPTHESLVPMLNGTLVGGLLLIETKDGTRYYLPNAAALRSKEGDPVTRFNFIVDNDLNLKPHSIPSVQIKRKVRAPHSVLASHMLKELDAENLQTSGWDRRFVRMLNGVLSFDDAEPVVRLLILQRTLNIASGGSQRIKLAFQKHARTLEREAQRVDLAANWVDPSDSTGRVASGEARKILEKLRPIQPNDVPASGKQAPVSQPSEVKWVARLARSTDGEWLAAGIRDKSISGRLFVVVRTPDLTAVAVQVGQLDNGALSWGDDSSELLLEGRPLFLSQPKSDESSQ